MVTCKRCGSPEHVNNGIVRGKRRYRCKVCAYNYTEGDARVVETLIVKKALAVLLYALGKASFGFLGKIFGVSRSLTYRWIRDAAAALPEPTVSGTITEMEFDEMWHFIGAKKTNAGSSKPWIVGHGELWPGCSVIVILPPSNGSTPRWNT